jgi:hypothetical protein
VTAKKTTKRRKLWSGWVVVSAVAPSDGFCCATRVRAKAILRDRINTMSRYWRIVRAREVGR